MLITAAVLVALIAVRNRLSPGTGIVAAVLLLLVTRVLTADVALAGLANPALATVAALYVLARAVRRTDALGSALGAVVGDASRWRPSLARLLAASTLCSAFVNNTPIVAMMAPAVTQYADERRVPPSRYLLPMVYAVSLGGTLTLIGTSTNLVVAAIMARSGLAPLKMLEMTPLAAVVAALGLVVLVASAPRLLSDRRSARSSLESTDRDYAISLTVVPGGPLDGATVEASGLRHLQGVFLVELAHGAERVSPVRPDTTLDGGDRLTFVGRADDIVDLERIKGLASSEERHLAAFDPGHHAFFEAVLGAGSPLVGKTLREVGFRSRYQGAVVAIHRNGERLHAKLGSVRLRATDTLLFIADPGFRRNDFLLVNRIGRRERVGRRKGRWVGLAFVAVVLAAGLGVVPLLEASLLSAALVVALGVVNTSEAREAVDLEVLSVIAGSFALGAAVDSSGLARWIGEVVIALSQGLGARGALLGVVLVTVALAQFLTCNAAAAIAVPIAMAVPAALGLHVRPFLIATTIAASSSYLTPLGYQTKMMVYGPGGYRASDYLRLGLPLTVAVVAALVLCTPLFWPL